jgi:hypothetical protein
MFSGRIACKLAVITVLCVVSLFLFPAAQGSYTSVHGPVTALQSVRAVLRLRLAMIAATLSSSALLLSSAAVSRIHALFAALMPDSAFPDFTSVLRC